MSDDKKIVQVIPGGGWGAVFSEDNGEAYSSPVLCWALLANGDIQAVDVDGSGWIETISGASNLQGYIAPDDEHWCREPSWDRRAA